MLAFLCLVYHSTKKVSLPLPLDRKPADTGASASLSTSPSLLSLDDELLSHIYSIMGHIYSIMGSSSLKGGPAALFCFLPSPSQNRRSFCACCSWSPSVPLCKPGVALL